MGLHLLTLGLLHPVLETLLIERIGLTVDTLVVEWMRARIVDTLHFEGHPAAVARRVGQELHVVARAAERRDMLAVLRCMAEGRTVINRGHRHRRLQVVQLRRCHRVELFAAHQPVLRQCQPPGSVGLRHEVGAQRRGQDVVEPRRLVRALPSDEHQHQVVHLHRIDPSRHHAHEPFLQALDKEQLLVHPAGHAHRHGEFHDIVLPVPWRQVIQVVQERMELRREVRFDQVPDVLLAHALRR